MEDLFHLTSSLAQDFLHDRLSERDRAAIARHLEDCQECRGSILSSVRDVEYPVGLQSPEIDERVQLYRNWMKWSGGKLAGGKNVLWP